MMSRADRVVEEACLPLQRESRDLATASAFHLRSGSGSKSASMSPERPCLLAASLLKRKYDSLACVTRQAVAGGTVTETSI